MPTKQIMIQITFEDHHFVPVTMISQLGAAVFMKLDPKQTTVVREITTQERGCVLCLNLLGLNMQSAFYNPRVSAEVLFTSAVGADTSLFGPSCVPSPPLDQMTGIRLVVVQEPVTASPGEFLLAEFVGGGGHVYVDQIS
jgi:hypothetical protein